MRKMSTMRSPTIWPSHQQSEHRKTKDACPIKSDSIPPPEKPKLNPQAEVENGDGEKTGMATILLRTSNRSSSWRIRTNHLSSARDWDQMRKMTSNRPMPKTLMPQPKKQRRLNPKKVLLLTNQS